MSKRKTEWQRKQDEAKRRAAAKSAMVSAATVKLDAMWAAANADGSGFCAEERKAIAEAQYALQSIRGGWLVRR